MDTCNHVEFGNFEKFSILIFENEDKYIANQYDVNNHLDVLCKHKIISSETINSMHNKDQKFKRKTAVDKYSKVATYIPFKSAIDFQGNIIYLTVSLIYLDHNNENGIIVKFKIYITLYIYPCQIFSKHVTHVALTPQFCGRYKKNHMAAKLNPSRESLAVIFQCLEKWPILVWLDSCIFDKIFIHISYKG